MSRHSTLTLGLITAVVVYGFFGVVIPEYLVSDAFRSITPAIKAAAIALSLGLIVFSVYRFFRERSR